MKNYMTATAICRLSLCDHRQFPHGKPIVALFIIVFQMVCHGQPCATDPSNFGCFFQIITEPSFDTILNLHFIDDEINTLISHL